MRKLIIILSTFTALTSIVLAQVKHKDVPYAQEYAIKYQSDYPCDEVEFDLNGNIKLIGNGEVKKITFGELLIPGKVVDDNSYRFMKDKHIIDVIQVDSQFVYLDKNVIFSNAWAGDLFIRHNLSNPKGFIGISKLDYLVYNDNTIQCIDKGKVSWKTSVGQSQILEILFEKNSADFYVLTTEGVSKGNLKNGKIRPIYKGTDFVSIAAIKGGYVLAHRTDGLYYFNSNFNFSKKENKLPSLDLTIVRNINGNLWVGSQQGAFRINKADGIKYYASKRWLNDDNVISIKPGIKNNVLILTKEGFSTIVSDDITLADKANYFEKQVRNRHIRNGFNSTVSGMKNGDISTGYLSDSDNDGLWTSMYLASQALRYAVTKDPDALQNTKESLDAMNRLFTINPVKGFAARSFERTGHKDVLGNPEHWQKSTSEDWDWKATTSSDEAIGHIFAYGVVAELVDDQKVKNQAISLIDSMMTHIIDNDMYLVDFDGKPTLWGKWNPEYVNGFATNVGDRKLNSSNIIAMLQTAYHFTKKEKYKDKAFELMNKHGYLENLMRPMSEIGKSDGTQNDLSQLLSVYWNHSDDEMYFLGYWGLYRYAFNEELKKKYKEAILDHWQAELPEKDGLWNIMTGIVGKQDPGMKDAIWYLQKYPMDLIHWNIKNSERKDIELLEKNFRNQYTKEVLPPDELKISRHNGNRFILDGGSNGSAENSGGDIWLLPYWLGRYLNLIY